MSTDRVRAVKRKRNSGGAKEHHDVREVRKAAKKAKSFELQKVLKKLKDLRRKDAAAKEIPEIEAQLELLKHIDHESMANTALTTKIKKDKLLADNMHIVAILSLELASDPVVAAAPGTSLGKVQSRLLSSKVLASEVSSVIEGLKRITHPQPEAYDASVDEGEGTILPPSKKTRRAEGKPIKNKPQGDILHGVNDNHNVESDSNGDVNDTDGEGGHDGWESGTVSGNETISRDDLESNSGHSDLDDGDDARNSDQSDNDLNDAPVSRKRLASPESVPAKKGKSTTQSAFLPSLSVGFTRGDSDSEWSDSDEKAVDEVKKNRRGQRARRAIWEKKFGKNANHVKKHRDTAASLKRPRSSFIPADQRRERNNSSAQHQSHANSPFHRAPPRKQPPQFNQAPDSGWKSQSLKPQTNHGPPQNNRDQRPLHPSWEAKKKQKSASIVPAQGTKIVF
ncbi:Bud-site selection protein [Hygrophoropsis aurantiaca]|uniref:Bud-site selection protein n=1 Tax=Hygrophoropsis aurantiaca TaxID=72124 RepID=A0ACB8AQT6_9AGAM|nr:Bud-site selection protein [Hygrophoropsis aurantiaca]